MRGKIKTLKDSFGFITADSGEEVYFNKKSLIERNIFNGLYIGMIMEFELTKISRDELKVIKCRMAEHKTIPYFKSNVLQLSTIKTYDEFCDNALEYAKHLQAGKVTTSMLRKVYSRVLNSTDGKEIKMLRPQFAYIAGREKDKPVLKEFMDLLDSLAKSMEVENKEQLKNLKQFMEAIVAYMKYVGDAS